MTLKEKKIIKNVYDKLSKLSKKEFKKKLKEHENGDIAIVLRRAWATHFIDKLEEDERNVPIRKILKGD